MHQELFYFAEAKHFTRATKSLEKCLQDLHLQAPKQFKVKTAAAFTFGFDDYPAYERAVSANKSSSPPPRDEELLTREALAERRRPQAERFKDYADAHGLSIESPAEFIERWQPSSGRPFDPVIPVAERSALREQGVVFEALERAENLIGEESNPKSSDLDLIRKGLRCANPRGSQAEQLLFADAGMLAAALYNTGREPGMSDSLDLFELMGEVGYYVAYAHVAEILFKKLNDRDTSVRAKQVCRRLHQLLDEGREVFASHSAEFDFWLQNAELWMREGTQDNLRYAVQCFERAFQLGIKRFECNYRCGLKTDRYRRGIKYAAEHLALFYMPRPPGTPDDSYTNVVEPDLGKVLAYHAATQRFSDTLSPESV